MTRRAVHNPFLADSPDASNPASTTSARSIATSSPGAAIGRCRPSSLSSILIVLSVLSVPDAGQGFLPAGGRRPDAASRSRSAGTKIEKTQEDFAAVEGQIRKIVGKDQVDVILDNIGLPYSGINIALSDSATVGPMDGEILISLKEKHTPTAAHMADLRRELPRKFPEIAVLLPAGGYRQSGFEFRSARADRRAGDR